MSETDPARDGLEGALSRALRRIAPAAGYYHSLVESDHVGIALTTADGALIEANPPLLDLLGLHGVELGGTVRWKELTPREHRDLDDCAITEMRVGGASHLFRKDLLRKDGSRIPVLAAHIAVDGSSYLTVVIRTGADPVRERHLSLPHAITRILAHEKDLKTASRAALERICTETGWDVAAIWAVDAHTGSIRCVETWTADRKQFGPFLEATDQVALAPGTGLVGRIWGTGQPLWIERIEEQSSFPRKHAALASGLVSGVCLPTAADGAVNGVIEFYARSERREERALIELLTILGGQIGQYVERKQAERRILDGDERFRAMIENSWEAVALIDANGILLYSSPSGARLLGYAMDELLGQNVLELIHPDDLAETIRRFIDLQMTTGGREVAEYRYRHKNGDWIWLEASASNMLAEPSVAAVVVNYRDITERKRHEERIRFLADAGSLPVDSLDYLKTLRRTAELVVPTLADWCTVDIIAANGELMQFAVAHTDPERQRRASELKRRHPELVMLPICRQVIETRTPVFGDDLSDRIEIDGHDEETALLRGMTVRSYIIAPLIARGEVLGVLGLYIDESQRRYGPEDLLLATEIANRASVALDNARLYEREQSARRRAEETAARISLLQGLADATVRRAAFLAEASKVLASSLDIEATLAALASLAVESFSDLCIIRLDPSSGWTLPRITAVSAGAPAVAAELIEEVAALPPWTAAIADDDPGDMEWDGLHDEDRASATNGQDISSYISIPIAARNENLGTFSVALCGSSRRYDRNDLALVEDLAARVSLAIDNARLYRIAQEELAERKRTARALAQANARFMRLFESSIVGIIVADLDGPVVEANDAFLDMLGRTREELDAGRVDWLEMTPEEYHEPDRRRADESRASGILTPYEKELVRKDGSPVPVLTGGATISDDRRRFICFVVDLTERKKGEEERAELLSREQSARKEAETANRLKDEFLATVSHELRTPLNAILGWIQLLGSGTLDDETTARAIETIERNAKAQTQIIEDILDVSRIVSGKIRLAMLPVTLPAVIAGALDAVRLAAGAKGITIEFLGREEEMTVLGDLQRLEQIVWNLLSNAIKFTPEGGRVEVGLERTGRHAEIRVTDTGKGIDPVFLPYVFDRFRQADGSNTRPHGGLGLGLAIVRHIVELHGGSVSAESGGSGAGATFRVRLPLSPVSPAAAVDHGTDVSADRRDDLGHIEAEIEESHRRLDGIRILAVDDEIDTLRMLETALSRSGADVRAAGSAAEAFILFDTWRPDLLISDIGMPEEDGYSLIERIRRAEGMEAAPIPAIALTAYARSEDSARALRAGFNVHVAKPVEPAQLVRIAARLARGAGSTSGERA